jgi:hypothetical protein
LIGECYDLEFRTKQPFEDLLTKTVSRPRYADLEDFLEDQLLELEEKYA